VKFNLLDSSYICVSGTINFTIEDVENLLNNSCDVTVSGGDDIYISCDLVDRVAIDQIKYYFSSSTSSGIIVPTIGFYYKNDLADDWVDLQTNIGSGYYYTTITSPSAPRYIKLHHTIASGIGTVKGFEVLNDDSVVDFGADGNLTSSTTLTTLSYLNYNDYIKEIEIYNNGSSTATAHIFIDPQYNDVDALLSISASEDGPWVFSRNIDYIISNANNWDCGQYNNTSTSGVADGKLRLNPGYTVGTYMTPIFKNDSVKFAYIDMLQTAVSGSIIAVDSDDYTSTLQIRSSNTKPIDYNVYRVLYYDGPGISNQCYYKDFIITTDTEVYNSYNATGTYFGVSWTYYSFTYSFDYTQFIIDDDTQKTALIMATSHSNGAHAGVYWIDLYILSQEGIQLKFKRLASANYNTHTLPYNSTLYDMKFDSEGGIWIYNYINFTSDSYNPTNNLSSSYSISDEGYWLLHLDSNLNVIYNSGVNVSNFIIGPWAPASDDTSLWYCNKTGTQSVVKLTSSGTVYVSYENVTDLKGLCATGDGGCWFIDNDVLYKLNSSGILEDSITDIEINYELTFVEFDSEDTDFLWIADGIYVRRIRLDGSVFSSIYLEGFTINRLLPISEGLWIYCTEGTTGDKYAKYIGKLSSGVEKTIECVAGGVVNECSDVGIKYISYDNLILGNMIPLSDDIVWNDNLEWNKAITDNAVLPREEYNQLKLTLRRPNTGVPSPSVENIYYQDSVELQNIYPGQSKTLYLKISIPTGMSVGGDYSSMLRVWWELPAP